jgi:hypothetical protein
VPSKKRKPAFNSPTSTDLRLFERLVRKLSSGQPDFFCFKGPGGGKKAGHVVLRKRGDGGRDI